MKCFDDGNPSLTEWLHMLQSLVSGTEFIWRTAALGESAGSLAPSQKLFYPILARESGNLLLYRKKS